MAKRKSRECERVPFQPDAAGWAQLPAVACQTWGSQAAALMDHPINGFPSSEDSLGYFSVASGKYPLILLENQNCCVGDKDVQKS